MTRITAAAIVTLALLAGCAEKPAPASEQVQAEPAATPPVVDITATDYAYQAPDTIPGGWVTLRIHNNGKELHHGAVYRLEQGKTIEDLMKHTGPEEPAWVVAAGGPSAPGPGGVLETTLMLTPGNHILICEIPSPDGKLHFMKGMIKPLTVVAAPAEAQPAAADITVKLSDYAFEFSPELTAGKHTFRVETVPGQPHEVIVARLIPGKRAEDFLGWVEKMSGPPPIEGVVGGTTALGHGELNVFQAELTPGDYAIICFYPDAKDRKPHAAHGMLKTIKIS